MSSQYSPMSEDSDDCRFCETSTNLFTSQSDSSVPTSPVSPYRYQRPFSGTTPSTATNTSLGCSTSTAPSLQPHRGSDSEGRFPSSPSDICHSADLRRAALLRSVQMRTQPLGPSSIELPYCSMPEPGPIIEAAEQTCRSSIKSLVDERVYQLEECSSIGVSEPEYNEQKSCKDLNRDMKDSESGG